MTARESSTQLAALLRKEHGAMADFLVALAAFDEARLWADLGYTSLFYFLKRDLGLSSGAAYLRQSGAGLVRRFPEVVEPLRDGRLCLSTLGELAKVMTEENRAELLPKFLRLSKREAEVVVVELKPREAPPVRDLITTVASVFAPVGVEPIPGRVAAPSARPFHPDETPQPLVSPGFARLANVEPLTASLRRLHFTVSASFVEKLRAARDGMSGARPDATSEQVLEVALDLLLLAQARRRGEVDRPRKDPRPTTIRRHIPAEVKRAVLARDGGCCQWPLESGGSCGSRRRIQFDHIQPVELGGLSTVENVRLLCFFHNQLSARLVFGDDWMDRFAGAWAREPAVDYGRWTAPLRASS